MLDHEQIEHWQDDIHPDVMAAVEFSRRYHKGLPSDRWADGKIGAEAVARGIDRLVMAVARNMAEQAARNAASMSPGEPEYK